jgi:hypothetical protein
MRVGRCGFWFQPVLDCLPTRHDVREVLFWRWVDSSSRWEHSSWLRLFRRGFVDLQREWSGESVKTLISDLAPHWLLIPLLNDLHLVQVLLVHCIAIVDPHFELYIPWIDWVPKSFVCKGDVTVKDSWFICTGFDVFIWRFRDIWNWRDSRLASSQCGSILL